MKMSHLAAQWVLDESLLLGARAGFIERYQPLFGKNISGERSSTDRWSAIETVLPNGSFSLLDVGSQLGYFTLSAASRGALALGLERVWQYRAVAEALRRRARVHSAAFLQMEINEHSVQALPRFDVVICMSVYHHWVLDWGFQAADRIFSSLCEKTQSLVFETGQFSEVDQAFAKKMDFMGPDCFKWINTYLAHKGFSTVKHLGEFPTHLGPNHRHLVYASKSPR